MDISSIISTVVEKLTGDNSLIGDFLKNPAAVLKEKFNLDVSADQITSVVDGVKEKLTGLGGDTAEALTKALDSLKDAAGDVAEDAAKAVEGAKDAAEDAAEDASKGAESLLDKIKGLFGK